MSFFFFFKCVLTFENKIKWHQLVTRRPGGCCLPPQSCFLTSSDRLSALNETRIAASHEDVWGETVSSVRTPRPRAEVKLCWHSVSGRGGQRTLCCCDSSLWIFTSTFCMIHAFCPCGLIWLRHAVLATAVRTHSVQNVNEQLHIVWSTLFDLEAEIFMKAFSWIEKNVVKGRSVWYF